MHYLPQKQLELVSDMIDRYDPPQLTASDKRKLRQRQRVENLFCRLKQFKRSNSSGTAWTDGFLPTRQGSMWWG
jgi:hypothetical protein